MLSVAIYHTSIVLAINALLMKDPFFAAHRALSSRYIIIEMSLKKNHMHTLRYASRLTRANVTLFSMSE